VSKALHHLINLRRRGIWPECEFVRLLRRRSPLGNQCDTTLGSLAELRSLREFAYQVREAAGIGLLSGATQRDCCDSASAIGMGSILTLSHHGASSPLR
jgi:hypothetical protein